jgi:hypothetical protein
LSKFLTSKNFKIKYSGISEFLRVAYRTRSQHTLAESA